MLATRLDFLGVGDLKLGFLVIVITVGDEVRCVGGLGESGR